MKKLLLKTVLRTFLILGLTFAGSFLFAELTPAYAAQYYVAGDTGLDTNTGSSAQPWKTIQKAADIMVAGDTVNVKGGVVYTGSNSCGFYNPVVCAKNSGTSGNVITYQAWGGTGLPIISGDFGMILGYAGADFSINRKSYITVSGFSFTNSGIGIQTMGRDLIIKNNIFESDPSTSIAGVYLQVNSNQTNLNVYNNTFIGTGVSAQQAGSGNGTVFIQNNIVIEADYGIANSTNSLEICSNNLVFNNQTNFYGSCDQSQNIHADPLFIDPANGDFRLQPNSPAINAGVDVSAYGVTTDILGRARPNAGAYDIGAYEDPNIYVAGDVVSSGNGSMETPFKTIQEAATIATPGDIVNVKGNVVYSNSTCSNAIVCPTNSGTVTNPITYKTWDNTGVAIIDGIEKSKNGFFLINVNNIKLDSFKLINVSFAVNANVGNNITVQNFAIDKSNVGISFQFSTANIMINNNVVNNCGVAFVTGSTGSSNIVVSNNIATNNSLVGFGANNGYTGIISRNNIAYNNFLDDFASYYVTHSSDTVIDPQFVDPANSDFRLKPGSPAIDAGLDTSAYGVIEDLVGVPRPIGSAYDIGVFEFYEVPVTITSLISNFITSTSLTVSGIATTTATGAITSVDYSLDNRTWTTATGNFSFTLNNLTQGSHTIRVRATDSYGNQTLETAYATKTFIVDSISPTILLTKLGKITDLPDKISLTYYFTSQTPKIEGVTEANSIVTFMVGAETYTAQAYSNGNFVINLDDPKLIRGENDITYLSTDVAGNTSETRTLKLIVGEEYFPAWIYEKVVVGGQTVDEVDQDGEPDEEPTIPAETYKILFTDENGNPLANTRVEIDGRFYTTDADGYIYVTDLKAGTISYKLDGVKGTLAFDPEKEANNVVISSSSTDEKPDKNSADKDESSFNWWWIIVILIPVIGGSITVKNYRNNK